MMMMIHPTTTTEKPPQSATTTTTTSDDLPRAHVKRIMKHQLAKFSHVDAKTNAPFEPHIAKDALDGVQQACKIFIHYVTSTANDICTESKRSTLSAVRSFEFFPHTFGGMSSSSPFVARTTIDVYVQRTTIDSNGAKSVVAIVLVVGCLCRRFLSFSFSL